MVQMSPYVKVGTLERVGFPLKCSRVSFLYVPANETGTILGLEVTWFVVVVISTVLVLLVCIVAISIPICRRGWNVRSGNGNVQQQNASYSRKWWFAASLFNAAFPVIFTRRSLIRVESSSATKLICTHQQAYIHFFFVKRLNGFRVYFLQTTVFHD